MFNCLKIAAQHGITVSYEISFHNDLRMDKW